MTHSFNLVREAWIPCLTKERSIEELGVYELVARAPDLVAIDASSPLTTVALYRLLIAFLHRALDGPADSKRWAELWKAGSFSMDKIDAYLAEWEERFDLFHPKWPFYQVADFCIISTGKGDAGSAMEAKSPSAIALEDSSGNNALLFDHHSDSKPISVTAAEAACRLVTTQAYAVGGGQSGSSNLFGKHPNYTDGPLVGGIACLLQGQNLFEDLLLNMLPKTDWPCGVTDMNGEHDQPSWEKEKHDTPIERHVSGYLDYLTFQPRAVRLIVDDHDGDLFVAGVYLSQLSRFGDKQFYKEFEPMGPKYIDKKNGIRWVGIQKDRALWRDAHTLMVRATEEDQKWSHISPKQVINTARHTKLIGPEVGLRCTIYGIYNNKAKVMLWRGEQLPVPLSILNDEMRAEALIDSLANAEEIGTGLRKSLFGLAKKIKHNTASELMERSPYWSMLEEPFHELLAAIAGDGDLDHHVDEWTTSCLRTAKQAFEAAADLIVGRSGKELEWRCRARGSLGRNLGKLEKKLMQG